MSDLAGEAQRILRESLAPGITLEFGEAVYDYPGSPSTIVRYRTVGAPAGAPSTVIVKRSNTSREHLLHEWAALEFLAANPDSRPLVPGVLGGSREKGVLILDDLGSSKQNQLGEILEGENEGRAVAALVEFQRALGRLHASSMVREEEYDRTRARLGEVLPTRHRIHQLLDALEECKQLPGFVGVSAPTGFKEEIDEARREIAEPGEFLTFTHGDSTPSNAFYVDSRIVFFDLEASGYRHALLDGSYARLRYIHSVWARRIPAELRRRLLMVYREELIAGCRAASDDGRFHAALMGCSAGWLAGILQLLTPALNKDVRWGRSTNRQRIVTALDHFAELATELNRYPAMAGAATALADKLRSRWGEEATGMPFHRAFLAGGGSSATNPRQAP